MTTTVPPAATEAGQAPTRRRWAWAALAAASTVMALLLLLVPRGTPKAAGQVKKPRVEGHTIILTPAFRRLLDLQTTPVRSVALTPIIKVTGTIDFDPRHVASVGTRLSGFVRSVLHFEGDSVRAGELLATMDSPELGAAQAHVLEYRARLTAAEANHRREQALSARGLSTMREAEAAAATYAEYQSKVSAAEHLVSALAGAGQGHAGARAVGTHEIRAPLSGTVVERKVSAGQSVERNLTAFRVANLDYLWVELAVYERDLARIRKGDRVELSPLTKRGEVIDGEVAHVGERVDDSTRTAVVRVEIDNRARKLRQGQAVTAKIWAAEAAADSTSVVPQSAVTYVDGAPMVFVAESELRITATPVKLGEGDGSDREVLSGVSPGQPVVSKGVFALKSELYR